MNTGSKTKSLGNVGGALDYGNRYNDNGVTIQAYDINPSKFVSWASCGAFAHPTSFFKNWAKTLPF